MLHQLLLHQLGKPDMHHQTLSNLFLLTKFCHGNISLLEPSSEEKTGKAINTEILQVMIPEWLICVSVQRNQCYWTWIDGSANWENPKATWRGKTNLFWRHKGWIALEVTKDIYFLFHEVSRIFTLLTLKRLVQSWQNCNGLAQTHTKFIAKCQQNVIVQRFLKISQRKE